MSSSAQPSTPRVTRRPLFLESCIFGATWLSLSGWVLSYLGVLGRDGYVLSLTLGTILLAGWLRAQRAAAPRPRRSFGHAWRRRLRRPLPAIFALIFVLAALGGALYPPNNFDALTYRLPQLLQWLEAGRWHWILGSNLTLNITAPGYSWLMAPLLALTGSDRGFFLPNILAFALLPGCFFTVLRECGVRARVAWSWMWLLPSGYCYAMQAGGIANDLLPTTYLVAAVALALRARRDGRVPEAWFSILAAALATGVKVVVLPLGLPWLVAILPNWRLLLRRPIGTVLIAALALVISFLPTALLNHRYTGDWSGDPEDVTRLRLHHPGYGLVVNTLTIVTTNLAPPLCPVSGKVNAFFERALRTPAGEKMRAHYPRIDLRWFELAAEDGSGIGLGIFILGGVALIGAIFYRRPHAATSADQLGRAIGLAAVVAMLAYNAKMGSEAAARLIAAFYPFLLIPVLRLSVNDVLVRRRWWRALAALLALSIVPALILTPARPLWPAHTLLARLAAQHPESAFLQRTQLVYDVFAQRYDYLAPLKHHLPAGAKVVGFVPTGNDLEGSLWRPFGSRRVVEVLHPHRRAVRQLAGSVIVSSRRGLSDHFALTAEDFAKAVNGRVIAEEKITLKASVGPEPFVVIAVD